MELQRIDLLIIVGYIVTIIVVGWLLSKRASKDLDAYFLGGKSLPWYVIGTSHGASGFDITGTMWFVAMLFTYGLKAAFVRCIWGPGSGVPTCSRAPSGCAPASAAAWGETLRISA